MGDRIRTLIMGAAGRDFHNFNTVFRDDDKYEVVAFTATQIPNIDGRLYPPSLAGELYPDGIPIYDEADLDKLIKEENIDQVIFAYSDVSNQYIMNMSSRVNASGAQFSLMGSEQTMVKSTKPVVAICAVRTGSGKSQTTRKVAEVLKEMGKKVAVIRHPMPYGDLAAQTVQRFANYDDLDKHQVTIEEREEYEPHIARGNVVYAGVDYEAILRKAEEEADVIIWDGGNNDMPFYKPDIMFVVADPHRAGHELTYYPGATCLRMADVVIINKVNTADRDDIETVRKNIKSVNPGATIIEANSPVTADDPALIKDKRVLVVEDGPTLTHGGMKYGAGVVAAEEAGADELVDPREYAVGTIKDIFDSYPDIGILLPAMGYGEQQIRDLEETINAVDCDVVIIGTPIDLTKLIKIQKPVVRVTYELEEIGDIDIKEILKDI
ncbi:GTPase [Candidatus Marinimicrobia bacterium MT.SAG.2]|nr:GTPase [Candidatus Marinimicrobia bacterium MT.SAG.2]